MASAAGSSADISNYLCKCGINFSSVDGLITHLPFCKAVLIKEDSTTTALLSVSKQPQSQLLAQAYSFADVTTSSVTKKPQELIVGDPFAQAAMELRKALAAEEEIMAKLKVSETENGMAALRMTEQLILSTKQAQNLFLMREIMFHKVLIPRDVSKLNYLVIPKVFAEKYFPKLLSSNKSLLLDFEDLTGKVWTIQFSYSNTHQCHVLAEGWGLFVVEKQLSAGDTVFFYRGVGVEAKNKFFIHWNHRGNVAKPSLTKALHPDLTLQLASPSGMNVDDASALFTPSFSKSLESLCNSLESPCNSFVDGMSSDDSLSTPAFKSYYSSLNHSDDDDALAPSSLAFSLSLVALVPSIKKSFDRIIANNALCYCALFPDNYEFEKDTVVQLLMAHGVFVVEPMERVAGLFFKHCLTRGYFLFCRTNLVTGKAMYTFKRDESLVSSLISSSSHIVLIEENSNLNDVSVEVSHVYIGCCSQKNFTILQELERFKQLRTLMFLHGHELNFKQVPHNLFLSLKLLQVLDLSQTHLLELPSSIGNLKCLRYLDLSETLIKRLPEAIDCLEKLQTLKLRGCLNLSFLPKGMRKLVNLRHLDLDVCRQLRSMPPGLGTLIHIQTLSAFLVDLEEECSIRQLQNMNNLSGSFCISRLENVLTEDEAMEACLCNKSQLTKLELQWSDTQDEDVSVNGEILSSLKPNTSLEELRISCFDGFDLPSWICDPAFSKLVSITLFKCENCLGLPSLGQLPLLKFLNIMDFYKLKVIDRKFYGGLGIQGFIAFPKLEKLAIENMLSLDEWTGMEKPVFPCLLTLSIKSCPKLCSLHTLSNLCYLKNLEISQCDMLASWTDCGLPASVETLIIEGCPMISVESLKTGGQDWHKVAHIKNVWVDNQEIPSGAAA